MKEENKMNHKYCSTKKENKMKRKNDRNKILRAISRAGFYLAESESKFSNKEYTLISEGELLYPFERRVK
jgi:hypothetical protein